MPVTVRNGLEFVLDLDGSILGGTTQATETLSINNSDIQRRDTIRESHHMPGRRSHSISFEGMVLEDSDEIQGHGSSLKVVTGTDSTTGDPIFTLLEEITQITLNLGMEVNPYPGMNDAFWRRCNPGVRTVDLSCESSYVDPADSEAWAALRNAARASERIETQLAFGTSQYDLSWALAELGREMPNETATGSTNGPVHGLPNRTVPNTPDPGLDALLANFFATPTPALTATMKVKDETDTLVSGATMQTASVYPTELEISIPEDGPVECSGTLTTDGEPTEAEQA